MKLGYKTHVGMVRQNNEDSLLVLDGIHPDICVLAVADGMGGHNAGEVASSMAIQGIKDYFMERLNNDEFIFQEKQVDTIIKKINTDIFVKSKSSPDLNGMGTTLTMMIYEKKKIYIAHIGDSRLYKINNKEMKQITQDHSLVAQLVRNGEITQEEALKHPQKNIITRALGTEEDILIDSYSLSYHTGDIILLCTDGLTNSISDREIEKIIKSNANFQLAVEKLIEKSNENGGKDNTTAIIFQC